MGDHWRCSFQPVLNRRSLALIRTEFATIRPPPACCTLQIGCCLSSSAPFSAANGSGWILPEVRQPPRGLLPRMQADCPLLGAGINSAGTAPPWFLGAPQVLFRCIASWSWILRSRPWTSGLAMPSARRIPENQVAQFGEILGTGNSLSLFLHFNVYIKSCVAKYFK